MSQKIKEVNKTLYYKTLLTKATELLLGVSTTAQKKLVKITVSSDKIELFEEGRDDLGQSIAIPLDEPLVEDSDINVTELKSFITNYPKVKFIPKSKTSLGRKYHLADVEPGVTGQSFSLVKKVLYIDETLESKADNRTLVEKMAEYRIETLRDLLIHNLLISGIHKGMSVDAMKSVYGYDEETNSYDKFDSDFSMITSIAVEKDLSFSKLNYPYKVVSRANSRLEFVEVQPIVKRKLNPTLKEIIRAGKPGIIVLDNLNSSDLLNSDVYKDGEIRVIHSVGKEPTNMNPYLIITGRNDGSDVIDIPTLRRTNYSMVMDTESELTYEEIISLAQKQLVIVSWSVSSIKKRISEIRASLPDENRYFQLIDNMLYIGSIYTNEGLALTDVTKLLLKKEEFDYFGEVIGTKEQLTKLIQYIEKPEIEEFSVKNSLPRIKRVNENARYLTAKGKPINIPDKQIINLLWKITNPNEHETMMEKLQKNLNYSTIFELTTYLDGEQPKVDLIRITVFKNNGLDLVAQRLPVPLTSDILSTTDKRIIGFEGTKSDYKTRIIKGLVNELSDGMRTLIIDEDFLYDKQEFMTAERVFVLRDNELLTTNLLRTFEPEVIAINTEITDENLEDIVTNMSDETKLIYNSRFGFDRFLKPEYVMNDNYKSNIIQNLLRDELEIIEMEKVNEKLLDRDSASEIITSYKQKKNEIKTTEKTKPIETKPIETKPIDTKPIPKVEIETKPIPKVEIETKPIDKIKAISEKITKEEFEKIINLTNIVEKDTGELTATLSLDDMNILGVTTEVDTMKETISEIAPKKIDKETEKVIEDVKINKQMEKEFLSDRETEREPEYPVEEQDKENWVTVDGKKVSECDEFNKDKVEIIETNETIEDKVEINKDKVETIETIETNQTIEDKVEIIEDKVENHLDTSTSNQLPELPIETINKTQETQPQINTDNEIDDSHNDIKVEVVEEEQVDEVSGENNEGQKDKTRDTEWREYNNKDTNKSNPIEQDLIDFELLNDDINNMSANAEQNLTHLIEKETKNENPESKIETKEETKQEIEEKLREIQIEKEKLKKEQELEQPIIMDNNSSPISNLLGGLGKVDLTLGDTKDEIPKEVEEIKYSLNINAPKEIKVNANEIEEENEEEMSDDILDALLSAEIGNMLKEIPVVEETDKAISPIEETIESLESKIENNNLLKRGETKEVKEEQVNGIDNNFEVKTIND